MIKKRLREIISILLIAIIAAVIGFIYFHETDITDQSESYYIYIDEKGNPVSEEVYSSAFSFNSDGIALIDRKYKARGKEYFRYDYIDTSFESVTPKTWDSKEVKYYSYDDTDTDFITYTTSIPSDTLKIMDSSFEEIAQVKDVLIQDEYLDINGVQDGLILVRAKNGLFGFANTDGEWVIEGQFEDADPFKNGIASVLKDGHWGGIDKNGNFVIEPKYDMPFSFLGDGEIAAAKTGDSVRYIDRTGQEVIDKDYSYSGCQSSFSDGLAFVLDSETNLYGYIDKTGEYVIAPQFAHACAFVDGVAAASKMVDGKEQYGYINKQGEVLVDFKFDLLDNYSEEHPILAQLGDKYGYIDSNGNWVILPIYESAAPFSNGYAVVQVSK